MEAHILIYTGFCGKEEKAAGIVTRRIHSVQKSASIQFQLMDTDVCL